MLRDCFGPCFRLMLRLPDTPPTGRAGLRLEAERLLGAAGHLALRKHDAATVETARRMVEAWMDETALGTAWEGRAAWLGNPLQRRWRTGRRGGDWFFEETRRLSPHRPGDAELAGVALRCLGFGFRGHFYGDPRGLSLAHRTLAERFGQTAVPVPFPPDPHISEGNRLIRHAGPLLAGIAAACLLIFWGLWEHRLNREFAENQSPATCAPQTASAQPIPPSVSPSIPAAPKGQKNTAQNRQHVPDVYGELRNSLEGRTPDGATHKPGRDGANGRNAAPGRPS